MDTRPASPEVETTVTQVVAGPLVETAPADIAADTSVPVEKPAKRVGRKPGRMKAGAQGPDVVAEPVMPATETQVTDAAVTGVALVGAAEAVIESPPAVDGANDPVVSDGAEPGAKPVDLGAARASRLSRMRLFMEDTGFRAAGLFVAVGAGWIIGANSFDDAAQSRQLADKMQVLEAKLEQVEQQSHRSHEQENGALRAQFAALEGRLEAARSGTAKATTQFAARLDRVEHAAMDPKLFDQVSQRLDALERRGGDTTASIPQARADFQASNPVRDPHELPLPPETSRIAGEPARIPPAGYILRRVRDGSAVVESRAGLREIAPGDLLPGAGRVRAIERRAGEWVVVTSGGVIDSRAY